MRRWMTPMWASSRISIRQFSENSQFIIVTHNKMTMSTVDVICGVTMQEPGVSKLVLQWISGD